MIQENLILKQKKNIILINKFFDENLAIKLKIKYKNKIILFVSDIRTLDIKGNRELVIVNDNENQRKWYNILKPYMSMLKFHLPYSDNEIPNKIEYLDGDIYFQSFAGQTSSETRLYVSQDAKLKIYDCIKYENQMFYFNNFYRTLLFKHDIKLKNIDHCYDCYTFIYVLKEYIKYMKSKLSINYYINMIYNDIYAYNKIIDCTLNNKYYTYNFTDKIVGKIKLIYNLECFKKYL